MMIMFDDDDDDEEEEEEEEERLCRLFLFHLRGSCYWQSGWACYTEIRGVICLNSHACLPCNYETLELWCASQLSPLFTYHDCKSFSYWQTVLINTCIRFNDSLSNLESLAKYGRPPLVFKLRKQYVRDNLRKNIAVQDSLTLLKTCMFIKHTNISFKDLNKLRHIYVSVCIYLILWNRCRYFFSISDLASVAQWSCTGPNYRTRPMMISFILINDRLKWHISR